MKQVQQDGVNKLEGFCNVQNVRSPRQLFLIQPTMDSRSNNVDAREF